MATWKKHNPNFEFRLWTNENLPKLPPLCQRQFDRYGAAGKWAFQADILRYYLIFEYGGIYADIDFECFRSVEDLLRAEMFVAAPNLSGHWLCNGIFGSTPGNPILRKILCELKDETYHGPLFFTDQIKRFYGIPLGEQTPVPGLLTRLREIGVVCFEPEFFFSQQENGLRFAYHWALKSWHFPAPGMSKLPLNLPSKKGATPDFLTRSRDKALAFRDRGFKDLKAFFHPRGKARHISPVNKPGPDKTKQKASASGYSESKASPDLRLTEAFHRHKCIFIHIPKCAGTSVRSSLFGDAVTGNHWPLHRYQSFFDEKSFNEYFKFCFIRNPWDRLVSAFFHLKKDKGPYVRAWGDKNLSPYPDFESFVRRGLRRKKILQEYHFFSQLGFIRQPDGTIPIDFVGCVENLETDFSHICHQLNIKKHLLWQKASRPKKDDYRQHYSEETRRIVEEVYSEDIEVLGYSFDHLPPRICQTSAASLSI